MRGRRALLVGTTIAALAFGAAPAQADHHGVRIAEVFPGSDSLPNVEYVQLQMAPPGQRFFGGTNSVVTLQAPMEQ